MGWRVLLGVLLAFLVNATVANATISVNTTNDEVTSGDGTCSLREAVAAGNGLASPDCPGAATSGGTTTIVLPAGAYHLRLGKQPSFSLADLELDQNITIQGASTSNPSQTVIDGQRHARVFYVGVVTASLTGVTITGGETEGGGFGGNGTGTGAGGAGSSGGDGGGIFSSGTLTLTGVTITGNSTGSGGAGGNGGDNCTGTCGGAGGFGGSGAGLVNDGSATLTNVVISGNTTGDGGDGGLAYGAGGATGGAGGGGGSGGGVSSNGPLTMNSVTITGNSTGNGGAGGQGGFFSTAGGTPGPPGAAGNGGDGGGIWDDRQITASQVTLAGNQTGNGGAGGTGGESFNGAAGNGASGGTGGRGGHGSALYAQLLAGSSVQLTNATLSGGADGNGGYGGDGGLGFGSVAVNNPYNAGQGGTGGPGGTGQVYLAAGAVSLTAATVSGGTAGAGGGPGAGGQGRVATSGGAGGSANSGSGGSSGAGGGSGGLAFAGGASDSLTEQDTLVASNAPANCSGTITDAGRDLSFPDTSCPHAVTGDPKLGPLAANGGTTQTEALGAGSAAIDQVPATGAGCPATDQRGVARPQPAGSQCDIGAYEYAPPVCQAVTSSTGAGQPVGVQLSCADPAGLGVTYALASSPAHGALTGLDPIAGRVTYTPSAGFTGTDSFRYSASDANGSASPQIVTITVRPAAGGGGPSASALTKLHLTHKRFRVGTKPTAISAAKHRTKAPVGTSFVFTLSAPATVRIAIFQQAPGLRRGKVCVKPTAKLRHRRARSCTRTVPKGTLTRRNEPHGTDSVPFSGRMGRKPLSPGKYLAKLIAVNAGGRSRQITVRFTIVR